MDLSKFDDALADYIGVITPTETQLNRIDNALASVAATMLSEFPDAEIYPQGSFATETVAKPLTNAQNDGNAGEYDVDIVVERTDWAGPKVSLDAINTALEEHGIYATMSLDNSKNSCVRINYADEGTGVKFHVDLVPTLNTEGERKVANREEDSWIDSDAKRFADYFNDRANNHTGMRNVAIMLKHLRDLNGQSDNIKSILILSLIDDEGQYVSNGSIMGDLLGVLVGIASKFSTAQAPYIANPVNEDEDLSSSMSDYNSARTFFRDLNDNLVSALTNQDFEALAEIFGTGFSYEEEGKNEFKYKATVAAATAVAPMRAYGGVNEFNNL